MLVLGDRLEVAKKKQGGPDVGSLLPVPAVGSARFDVVATQATTPDVSTVNLQA